MATTPKRREDGEERKKLGFVPSVSRPVLPPSPIKAGQGLLSPATVGKVFGQAVNVGERAADRTVQALERSANAAAEYGAGVQSGYKEARGIAAPPATARSPEPAPAPARPNEMVGGYRRELTPGSVKYTGPGGTMEGRGAGGGTYSEVSGPGSTGLTPGQWKALPNQERIARNVAAIESQTQAVRDARNTGRIARGERLVGDRGREQPLVIGENTAVQQEALKRARQLFVKADEAPGPRAKKALLDSAAEMLTLAQAPARPGVDVGDQVNIARLRINQQKLLQDRQTAEQDFELRQREAQRKDQEFNFNRATAESEQRQKQVDLIQNDERMTGVSMPAAFVADMSQWLLGQVPGLDIESAKGQVFAELQEMGDRQGKNITSEQLEKLKENLRKRTEAAMQ